MNMQSSPFTPSPQQPKAKIFTRRKQGQATNGRMPGKNALVIDAECLSRFFGVSQRHACEVLGIGLSTMKRMCRKLGIKSWPGPGSCSNTISPSCSPPPPQYMPAFHHPINYPVPAQFVPHMAQSYFYAPAQSAPAQIVSEEPQHEISPVWIKADADSMWKEDAEKKTSRACELELFGFALPSSTEVARAALPDFMSDLNAHKNTPEEQEEQDSTNMHAQCSDDEDDGETSAASSDDDDEFVAQFIRMPSSSSSAQQQRRSSVVCEIDDFLFAQNQRGFEEAPLFSADLW